MKRDFERFQHLCHHPFIRKYLLDDEIFNNQYIKNPNKGNRVEFTTLLNEDGLFHFCYLEKTGVLDVFTKVLVGLFEEPERPNNAIEYIKKYIGAPSNVDVDSIKRENEVLKMEVDRLKRQLSQVQNQQSQSQQVASTSQQNK